MRPDRGRLQVQIAGWNRRIADPRQVRCDHNGDSHPLFRQHPVDELNGDRSFAHGGGHPFHAFGTHIAHREN